MIPRAILPVNLADPFLMGRESFLFSSEEGLCSERSGSLLGEGVSIRGPQPPCLLGVISSFMWQAQAWHLCCQHLPAILLFETPWQPECSRTAMFRSMAGPQGIQDLACRLAQVLRLQAFLS